MSVDGGYFSATVGAVIEQTVRQYIGLQSCDEDVEGFKVATPESL